MVVFGVCAALTCGVLAEVRLGTPFADGMVLQRGMDVAVWGTDDAGSAVAVSFAGTTVETKADDAGRWSVKLPKLEASAEGRELVVKGTTTVTLADVLVGEVWFCCGQSNTELPLVGNNPHFSDREGRLVAQLIRKPLVRYVYASNYKWSPEPKAEAAYPVVWKTFTPENLGKAPSFSAMGVYFALQLHDALGVPVGIVGSYWGGTNIDAWTPRCGYEGKESLRDVADWKIITEDWRKEFAKGPIGGSQQQPTVLWNEMVAPWCPMAMRGFIWYQGCHNNGEAERYCDKMHALYDGWAKSFANPDLKLRFVQLAPFNCSWFRLQLNQAKFAAEEKNAALVTTVDIGNNDDVHPTEKGTIGRRLAALALRHDYGFTDIVADAPVLKDVWHEEGRLLLHFDHAASGWYVYDPAWGVDTGFEIAGADGVWKKATLVNANGGKTQAEPWKTNGVVDGRDLILEADGIERPVKVRYLYNKPWTGVLYAKSGLPLGPFEAEAK